MKDWQEQGATVWELLTKLTQQIELKAPERYLKTSIKTKITQLK